MIEIKTIGGTNKVTEVEKMLTDAFNEGWELLSFQDATSNHYARWVMKRGTVGGEMEPLQQLAFLGKENAELGQQLNAVNTQHADHVKKLTAGWDKERKVLEDKIVELTKLAESLRADAEKKTAAAKQADASRENKDRELKIIIKRAEYAEERLTTIGKENQQLQLELAGSTARLASVIRRSQEELERTSRGWWARTFSKKIT